jgi:tol-pal system protein YbgF
VLGEIQSLEREVRELRDRVERQEFELERLGTRQRDLYDDLDQRLRNQERNASLGSGQSRNVVEGTASISEGLPPTAQEQSQSGSIGVGTPVFDGSADTGVAAGQVDETPQVPTIGASQSDSTAPGQVAILRPELGSDPVDSGGPVSASAQEAYDDAFGLLKQSRYNDAIQSFEQFIRDHPSNDLTDDAYYWLAEARYVTREFEASLNGFRTVTTNFANSQRVPASYLKIGYIQYEIGAYTDARETLTYIMRNFPTHRVAVSAETRLKKMDREGR